jgi:hypothetical protein
LVRNNNFLIGFPPFSDVRDLSAPPTPVRGVKALISMINLSIFWRQDLRPAHQKMTTRTQSEKRRAGTTEGKIGRVY